MKKHKLKGQNIKTGHYSAQLKKVGTGTYTHCTQCAVHTAPNAKFTRPTFSFEHESLIEVYNYLINQE